MLLGKWFMMFRSLIVSSSSILSVPSRMFDPDDEVTAYLLKVRTSSHNGSG